MTKAEWYRRKRAYHDYLNSDAWKLLRDAKLRSKGWKCEKCPAIRRLEVHHLNYLRLGHELMLDLQVLCHDCHMAIHGRTKPLKPWKKQKRLERFYKKAFRR